MFWFRGIVQEPRLFLAPFVFAFLFVCVLSDTSFAQVTGAQTRVAEDVIRVWKAGSPHRGDIPDGRAPADLTLKAAKLGCRIEIRSMPARDLSGLMSHALATNDEPDILVIDNMGLVEGIKTQLGSFDGIGRDPRVRKSLLMVSEAFRSLESTPGWQYLFKTSRNFAQAKLLAMMEPECKLAYGKGGSWTGDVKTNLEKTATAAAAAYFRHDVAALDALVGGRYLVDSELLRQPTSTVSTNKVCSGWGNQRLAFINTVTQFENDSAVGYGNLLEVLTSTGSEWRLLSLSSDPRIIARLQQAEFVLKPSPDSDPQLEPPTLIGPADGAFFSRWPAEDRPLLEWTSAGKGSILYLVEAQFANPRRRGESETLWSGRGFTLVPPVGLKTRATFGAGQQPHRWRVWAIDENGFTVRSDWRVVNYLN